jgi:NTE family protein
MRLASSNLRIPWLALESWIHRFIEPHAGRPPQPRIGLVLSCGGARGLAHVGAIQVFEEAGIPISAVIGSSMGAYVGALWCAGVSGKGLGELAAEIKDRRALLRLIDPVFPPTTGFLHGEKVRRHLERTLGDLKLENLPRQMFVVATDLDTVIGEALRGDTPVATAVHASCAIPGICAPVRLNNKRYVDGGASQPLPVAMLKKLANVDDIIAVNVMPTYDDIRSRKLKSFPTPPEEPSSAAGRAWSFIGRQVNLFAYGNVLDTFKRCLTAAQVRLIDDESVGADVLVHPFFGESRWHDFHNFDRYIEAGRVAAEAALPGIMALEGLSSNLNHKHNHETVPTVSAVGCRST